MTHGDDDHSVATQIKSTLGTLYLIELCDRVPSTELDFQKFRLKTLNKPGRQTKSTLPPTPHRTPRFKHGSNLHSFWGARFARFMNNVRKKI